MKSIKTILILSVIPITIFACGDSDDNSPSIIIHDVVTPEPEPEDDYPAVPEGYPENLKPVWLADYFDENLHANHVIMDRVGIELWNQGERGFVNITMDFLTNKVYLLYPDVLFVTWTNSPDKDELGPDGEPMQYLSSHLHANIQVARQFIGDARGKLFTQAEIEEMMAGEGDYIAQYPGLKLVDYKKAGYKPRDVLVDHCNQPGNRTLHYCR